MEIIPLEYFLLASSPNLTTASGSSLEGSSININWPLPISEISDKDKSQPTLNELESINI